jgi:toxin YoeB
MKPIQFDFEAFTDYLEWKNVNPKISDRINELIIDIDRNLFKVLGKPEPLNGNLSGCWSKRIVDEHPLIHKIDKDIIYIFSCHGHYSKSN